ncbi:hypothetical protein C1645_802426 [Glomus cerebriforme]|uniref:TLDc domain-containing protein n=1 Tax=Glomus cerebriforme TaxID=658196 RepID=A0A397TN19_9GLOM|nr:hypothetical protein C1645_802426 [Glomus cerebriforme]
MDVGNDDVKNETSIHFQNALSNQTKEYGLFILEKPNISPSVFEVLLNYIYSGKLIIKKKIKCLYVIIAAYDLQLQNVVEHLENYLIENDSAWKLPKDFFIVSEQRQLKKLEKQALKLACMDPKIIFKSKYFLKLNEGFLIQFLKRNDLELNEIKILKNLIYWGIANTDPTLKVLRTSKFLTVSSGWTSIDFMNLKKTLRNCIPYIRFFQMSLGDYTLVQNTFKDILPNGLDDEIMQHLKDFNPLVRTPINDYMLPPRESAYPFDSNIINASDAAWIASWIYGPKYINDKFQFKNMPYIFTRVYRGSVDGFGNYRNICKYNRVVIVIKVRNSGEIVGAYNPFGWDINYMRDICCKSFKNIFHILDRYFIFSLTNRSNPILSYHKKEFMSEISDDGRILFGRDLSVNGIHCTSEQYSFEKKIIDKERFELAELEIFRISNKNFFYPLF